VRLLLDTHALLWWLGDDAGLGARARSVMGDAANETFVSALSLAEIAIKQSIGKLRAPFISDDLIVEQGMTPLGFTPRHARKLLELPLHHRDPFDRMLIAQALEDGLTIVTTDSRFGPYGVPVLAASA
jgi:PIN domain nuclease of toxin-antitoxin system